MDQFQGCRLVDGVSVGPVDTNLEGFLDGPGQEVMEGGQKDDERVRMGGNQIFRIRKKIKSLSVMSDKIYYQN